MNDVYLATILRMDTPCGPPAPVFSFVHPIEAGGKLLAHDVAAIFERETGFSFSYHVEPIPYAPPLVEAQLLASAKAAAGELLQGAAERDELAPETETESNLLSSRTIGGIPVHGLAWEAAADLPGEGTWVGYAQVGDSKAVRARWSGADGSVLPTEGNFSPLKLGDRENWLELDHCGQPVKPEPAAKRAGQTEDGARVDDLEWQGGPETWRGTIDIGDGMTVTCDWYSDGQPARGLPVPGVSYVPEPLMMQNGQPAGPPSDEDEMRMALDAAPTDLPTAVRALIDEFGGDVPDYLAAAVGTVENVLQDLAARPLPLPAHRDVSAIAGYAASFVHHWEDDEDPNEKAQAREARETLDRAIPLLLAMFRGPTFPRPSREEGDLISRSALLEKLRSSVESARQGTERKPDDEEWQTILECYEDAVRTVEEAPAAAPARASVVVNMSGGVLDGASCDFPADVYVVDYDDDDRPYDIPGEGTASVAQTGAKFDPEFVSEVVAAIGDHDEAEDSAGEGGE